MSNKAPASKAQRLYSGFSWAATSTVLGWLGFVASVELAQRLYLLDRWEFENSASGFEVHSLRFSPGYDLLAAAGAALVFVLLWKWRTGAGLSAGVILALGAAWGLLLVVGIVLMPSLILSGRFPPIGVAPNGWPAAFMYVIVALLLIHGPRLAFTWRIRSGRKAA